ncbi:hypothetical protein FOXYSP1_08194 [Fusarium oxysporum f. sp. phaseoli]
MPSQAFKREWSERGVFQLSLTPLRAQKKAQSSVYPTHDCTREIGTKSWNNSSGCWGRGLI